MELQEKLTINNFFSIYKLTWEPKSYNIITGDIGAGKSLCLKLLYFIYDIFKTTMFDNFSNDIFNQSVFYSVLKQKFNNVFFIDQGSASKIQYTILKNEKEIFDFKINIKKGEIEFDSSYLQDKFENWQKELDKFENTFDAGNNIRKQIINEISTDIGESFPYGQLYFSDLRTLLSEPNNIITSDAYTNELLSYKVFLEKSFKNLIHDVYSKKDDPEYKFMKDTIEASYKILNIKDIEFDSKMIYLTSYDSIRKTPLNKTSSGQRELFHLLSFINLMQTMGFSYGKTNNIFIEEPEAHLFPNEQKLLIELLVDVYNNLNKNKLKWRFFITTHSPYILNALNNMLLKGSILDKKDDSEKNIINTEVKFPSLRNNNVSGIFIKKDDASVTFKNIMEKGVNAPYLFVEEMEKVTSWTNDDYNMLMDYVE